MKAELIDVMGDDLRVVNAARVSFSKESNWEWDSRESGYGGERVILSEKDTKLINYLAKNSHWTPFAHVQITMRETVPIFVARQRFKHTVGFVYNEVSRRYVDDEPTFYVPEKWRKRAENKKQGSSDEEVETIIYNGIGISSISVSTKQIYEDYLNAVTKLYNSLIESDVSPEQARMVLPQSMYTSYYVTGSLEAWSRAYKQRSHPHAQKEIADLAKMWYDIIYGIDELKVSWTALTT